MSKIRSVIRHEYLTIIKQPSFWAIMIGIPLLIAAVIALTYLGNKSSEARIKEVAEELKNISIIDNSGLIDSSVLDGSGLTLLANTNPVDLKERVRNGSLEALIVYPEDLASTRTYQAYLSTDDLTKSSSVTGIADELLKTSLFLPLGSGDIIALAQRGASGDVTMYKNGIATGGFNDYIAPGIFLLLFYIIFAFSISYMLSSVSEEKENRSMEMVLTYVKPRTLILGKLLAVSLVSLTQVTFFIVIALIAFFTMQQMGNTISLPAGISLDKISFSPLPIFFGAAYLIVGFLMFAGFMIATAAAAPSSKDANNFSAIFFIGAFVPFYFIMPIITDPGGPVVQLLTYFPLSSPVVSLLRNTVGNMEGFEPWLALLTMTVCMVISIWIAVKAFRLGALEFGSAIKLSKLFTK
jgi:ABC-2 type transport system permease protein